MNVKHYNGVDIIKMLCAVLIVCIHSEPFTDVSGILNSLTVNFLSRQAVPFFFIASGFFLFLKIDFEKPYLHIIKKYVLKILKFYLIWSAIYFPFTVSQIISADGASAKLHILLTWAKHMVFSAGYGFLWYLPATVVAVVLCGLCLKKLNVNVVVGIGVFLYLTGLLGQSYFGLIRPLQNYTGLWNVLSSVFGFIETTRNGLFEGFVFVALGAKLSKSKPDKNVIKPLICYVVSMALLLLEIKVLTDLDWKYGYDMYLMLLPAAYWLFRLALCIDVKNSALCGKLRVYSSLVYFSHMLIIELLAVIPFFAEMNSLLLFFAVFVLTVAADTAIIKLSKTKPFAFIGHLYK